MTAAMSAASAAKWAAPAAITAATGLIAAIDLTEVTVTLFTVGGSLAMGLLAWQQRRRDREAEERDKALDRETEARKGDRQHSEEMFNHMQAEIARMGQDLRSARDSERSMSAEILRLSTHIVKIEIGSRRLCAQVVELGGDPLWDPDAPVIPD